MHACIDKKKKLHACMHAYGAHTNKKDVNTQTNNWASFSAFVFEYIKSNKNNIKTQKGREKDLSGWLQQDVSGERGRH